MLFLTSISKLSCLRLPDVKSLNPPNQSFFFKSIHFLRCVLICAIWQPCAQALYTAEEARMIWNWDIHWDIIHDMHHSLIFKPKSYLMSTSPRWPANAPSTYSSVLAS